MGDYQINVHCECYHRRGVLYLANPFAWGRPCRRCRRGQQNIIVVAPPAQPAMQPAQMATPAQTSMQFRQSQPAMIENYDAMPSTLPPKYDVAMAAH